jgi:hypothetical protein
LYAEKNCDFARASALRSTRLMRGAETHRAAAAPRYFALEVKCVCESSKESVCSSRQS